MVSNFSWWKTFPSMLPILSVGECWRYIYHLLWAQLVWNNGIGFKVLFSVSSFWKCFSRLRASGFLFEPSIPFFCVKLLLIQNLLWVQCNYWVQLLCRIESLGAFIQCVSIIVIGQWNDSSNLVFCSVWEQAYRIWACWTKNWQLVDLLVEYWGAMKGF
jgi:hypothetical protein